MNFRLVILNAELTTEEAECVRVPLGFGLPSGKILRLCKALYGLRLRQAPKAWSNSLAHFMQQEPL